MKILESKTVRLKGELAEDPLAAKARDVSYLLSLEEDAKLAKAKIADPSSLAHLREIDTQLKAAQKKLALAMGNAEAHKKAKEEYELLLASIESDPLAVNYRREHAYLADELATIRGILER